VARWCAGDEHVLADNAVQRLSDTDADRPRLPRLALRHQPATRRTDQVDRRYTVAQNKPDYLLLLSKFCSSTAKHVSVIMYV